MNKQLKLAIKELEAANKLLREQRIAPALDKLELARDRLKSIGQHELAWATQEEINDLEAKGYLGLFYYAQEARRGR